MSNPSNQMRFEFFRGTLSSWEDLFAKAADFASRIGPERVVSIGHSEDANEGVVTVWYWQDVPDKGPAIYA